MSFHEAALKPFNHTHKLPQLQNSSMSGNMSPHYPQSCTGSKRTLWPYTYTYVLYVKGDSSLIPNCHTQTVVLAVGPYGMKAIDGNILVSYCLQYHYVYTLLSMIVIHSTVYGYIILKVQKWINIIIGYCCVNSPCGKSRQKFVVTDWLNHRCWHC